MSPKEFRVQTFQRLARWSWLPISALVFCIALWVNFSSDDLNHEWFVVVLVLYLIALGSLFCGMPLAMIPAFLAHRIVAYFLLRSPNLNSKFETIATLEKSIAKQLAPSIGSFLGLIAAICFTFLLNKELGFYGCMGGLFIFVVVLALALSHFSKLLPSVNSSSKESARARLMTKTIAYMLCLFLLLSGVCLGVLSGFLTVGGPIGGWFAGIDSQKAPSGFEYVTHRWDGSVTRGQYSSNTFEHGLIWAFIVFCLAIIAYIKIAGLIVGVFSRLEQKGLLSTTIKSWLKTIYIFCNLVSYIFGVVIGIKLAPLFVK